MERNRLSGTITTALNAQMTNEAHAAQIYLSYGAWAVSKGYHGIAKFLFKHSHEERLHMQKLVDYLLDRGAEVEVKEIQAPHKNPENIHKCFEMIFGHEVGNTKEIYKLVKMCFVEEDWATWSFMQWFVKEQIEEEALASNLLDRLKIAGGGAPNGSAIYELDKDMEKASA